MDIIENKKFILQDIRNELNRNQMKLIQIDINSQEYEQKLFELEVLKNELDLATQIDSLDKENLKQIIELLKKYDFIFKLPQEKILQLTNLIEDFKDYKDIVDIKISIPSIISEIHDCPFKKISNIEELNNFRNNVYNNKKFFEEEAIKLKDKLGTINIEAYNKLFQNVKNGTMSDYSNLIKLSNLGLERKIAYIKKLHNELTAWKVANNILKIFTKEEQHDFIKNVKEEILKYEKLILEEATSHIKYLISYNKTINLNVNNEETLNLTSAYLDIQDLIKEKSKSYESVLKECDLIESRLYNSNIQLSTSLKRIDETLIESFNEMGIKPEELTKSKIARLSAYRNLINRLIYTKEHNKGETLKKV